MDAQFSLRKVDIRSSDSIQEIGLAPVNTGRIEIVKTGSDLVDSTKEPNVIKTSDNSSEQAKPREYRFSDDKLTNQFIAMILAEDFEYGFSSNSEKFFKDLLKQDHDRTIAWLGSLYLNYLENSRVILGLLHILSHIRYETIYPFGQIIALAALSHKSIEVREGMVRAFENWANADSLKYLKTVKCEEKWLAEYIDEVISQLEEEIESNVIIG